MMKEQHSLGFGQGCTNKKKKKKKRKCFIQSLVLQFIFLSSPISGGIPLLYIGLRIAS